MSRYAAGTSVSSIQSEIEIRNTLTRFGADAIMTYADKHGIQIQFRCRSRIVRLEMRLPERDELRFRLTPQTEKLRSPEAAEKAWDDECRRLWRSLVLLVKAKLAAVDDGITEFEEEFLAHIVLPDNRRVADEARPRIASIYESGQSIPLLPPPEN